MLTTNAFIVLSGKRILTILIFIVSSIYLLICAASFLESVRLTLTISRISQFSKVLSNVDGIMHCETLFF